MALDLFQIIRLEIICTVQQEPILIIRILLHSQRDIIPTIHIQTRNQQEIIASEQNLHLFVPTLQVLTAVQILLLEEEVMAAAGEDHQVVAGEEDKIKQISMSF